MSIVDVYENGRFGLSFELFPPKNPDSEQLMWRTVEELVAFQPAMVTCTYGAGGSTRDKTLDVIEGVRKRYHLPVASHLTCVGICRRPAAGGSQQLLRCAAIHPRAQQSLHQLQVASATPQN